MELTRQECILEVIIQEPVIRKMEEMEILVKQHITSSRLFSDEVVVSSQHEILLA